MTNWVEWEGSGVDGSFVFFTHGWLKDSSSERTLLAKSLREIGVTSRVSAARALAEEANIELAFYGFAPGELFPETCDEHGNTASGDQLDTPRKVTFAVVAAKVNA